MARRQLTSQRFDRDHDIGGKSAVVARRAAGRSVRAADQYRTAGAIAGDLTWHAELGSYAIVAKSLARQQHDLRPYHSRDGDVYSLRRASSSARSCSVSRIQKGSVAARRVPPGNRTLACRRELP